MYGQNEPPGPSFGPPSVPIQAVTPDPAGSSAGSSGWPRSARMTAIALGVALVAIAAVAVVLVTSSRSDADEAKQQLADVRESLDSLSSDTESVEDQIDDLLSQQDDADAEKAALQATIDEQTTSLDDLNAQLAAAKSDESDLQAELAATQSDLDAAEAEVAAANDAAAAAAAGFAVEPKAITPVFTDFVVPTNRVACDGFANPDTACPPTFTLDGRFLQDGAQLFMEFAEVAKVPVGSFDGFTLVGETPVTSAAAFTCDGVDVATIMRVSSSPIEITVDPVSRSLTGTAYTFTWTISAAAANGCTASSRTYTGTLTF